MQDCKPYLTPMEQHVKFSKFEGGGMVGSTTYRQLIGSLIYLTNTQLDISYAVIILSHFMQQPRDNHWNETKRVLRYIQGTKDFGLLYKKTKNFVLGGFSNVDFARSIDDRASTSGYLMNMGSTTVFGSCKKQAIQQKQNTSQHGKKHVKLFGYAEFCGTWEFLKQKLHHYSLIAS
jgi:hypothetical protein